MNTRFIVPSGRTCSDGGGSGGGGGGGGEVVGEDKDATSGGPSGSVHAMRIFSPLDCNFVVHLFIFFCGFLYLIVSLQLLISSTLIM